MTSDFGDKSRQISDLTRGRLSAMTGAARFETCDHPARV
jgi:hypothetical protein